MVAIRNYEIVEKICQVHGSKANVVSTSALKSERKFITNKMILIFFAFLNAVFAKNWANGKSEIGLLTVNENFLASESFIGQPKFNASCDSDSLDAAVECEDSFLIKIYNKS